MPDPTLVVFDDAVAEQWQPFALTRPAGELLFGTVTLRARLEQATEMRCVLQLAAAHLAGFEEEGAPPVATVDEAPQDGDRLFLLSRWVPAWGDTSWQRDLHNPGPIRSGGRIVGWFAPQGSPAPAADFFRKPDEHDAAQAGVGVEARGELLAKVWELISRNPLQIATDIAARFPDPPMPSLPAGAHHSGEHPLIIHETARIEPGALFDTSAGPIWLEEDVTVRAFTRLAGPAYVGPGSSVLGGPVEAVSIGPVCRVRGELAETICLGYTNKQHDGHMGHAYLGRWVNLGAGTNNSDLKNNYGTIRLWTPDGETDTGEIKLGCLLGDHVKTGIGLLLNTGTVVGAGSNLYGAAMPPKYVPPFSWGTGDELVAFRTDKFLEVAERAMGRRKVALSDSQRSQLETAWERGRAGLEEKG